MKREKPELTPIQKEAMTIANLAGFIIICRTDTFSLYHNSKKLYGYSSYAFLTPKYIISALRSISFKEGYKKGQNDLKKQFHSLLKLEKEKD